MKRDYRSNLLFMGVDEVALRLAAVLAYWCYTVLPGAEKPTTHTAVDYCVRHHITGRTPLLYFELETEEPSGVVTIASALRYFPVSGPTRLWRLKTWGDLERVGKRLAKELERRRSDPSLAPVKWPYVLPKGSK